MKVGEDEDRIDANNVKFINVEVSPNLVHVLFAESDNKGRVRDVIQG
jgi:hypothetical protein